MGVLRPAAALFAALLLTVPRVVTADDAAPGLAGLTLPRALERLRGQGLNLIYSSELVRDEMKVTEEPSGATPLEILDSLLGAHGLTTRDGPDGSRLVVAATRAPASGSIEGTVHAQDTGEPLPGVEITLIGAGVPAWSERDGSFLLADLIPGTYTLEARAPGHVEAIQEAILVAEGRATAVCISLAPSPRFLGDVVVTPSRYSFLHPAPESRQFFDRAEVQRMPHLADDPFRVAHRLPGVAAADISAQFSARGGAPDEVQVVLDGLEIHDPYHLRQYNKGLSIIDSEVIGGVDLLTGGFPIEYGDRMSGVVDLSTTVPTAQRFAIGASGLNARALAEGAGDGGGYSWLVSTRVGYLDWLFHWLETIDESPDLAGSPKYWDLYTVLRRQLGDNSLLSLHLLVADDDVNAYDRNEQERAVGADTNLYGWANLFSAFGAGVTARTVLSATQVTRQLQGSSDPGALNFARVRDDRRFSIFGLKQDWEWEPRRSQVLKLGFDVSHVGARYDYDGSFITYDPLFTGSGPPWVVTREADVRAEGWQVALYTADRFQLAPGVTVELGVRWDRQTWTPGEDQLSPRLNLVWETVRFGTVRAAWGRFAQAQAIYELQVEDGVDTFFPAQSAEQAIVAWEGAFSSGLAMRVEVYRKTMTDLRPRFENLFSTYDLFPEGEPDRVEIAPDRAEARGVELVLKGDPRRRWSWWMGCTLAAVEDRIDDDWVPRSWDQRFAASANVTWLPGRNWTMSLAGLYHSGWPTTAAWATEVALPDGSSTVVSEVGERNAARTSSYRRVDLRVSRFVPLTRGSFSFFLEIMNLFDHQNVRVVENYSFTPEGDGRYGLSSGDEAWIPFFPTFGFTWTF